MSHASEIKAILFDWAGVFCTPGEPFAHPVFAEQTRLSIDELGAQSADIYAAFYKGAVSSQDFWKGIVARFSLTGVTAQELSAAYLASYRLYPGTLEAAQALRPRYKTALLSNLTPDMTEHVIREHGVEKYFDHLLFSNRIGFMKPEPESFALALSQLETAPEATLFIDDSPSNIAAAQALGLQTLLAVSPEQWQDELVRRTSAGSDHRALE